MPLEICTVLFVHLFSISCKRQSQQINATQMDATELFSKG